jgi:hypothetical protein
MWWRKRKKPTDWWEPCFDLLATYNTEKSRGIVHTEKWRAYMCHVQKRYNEKVEQHFDVWGKL